MSALARNPKRRLGALATLLVASGVVVGSGASFTSSSANPANAFAAGTLSQSNSKANAAILSAANLLPGATRTGTVDIKNTGSVAGTFSLSTSSLTDSSATTPLSAKLTVAIADCGLWTGSSAPSCASATPVYTGTIAGMGTVALGSFAANAQHRYQFTVAFPDGGTTGADNAYQGASTSVEYDWNAVS